MSFLKRLFGEETIKEYQEKNNRGTRYENTKQIISYWSSRQQLKQFDPFVMYIFKNESDARNALLSLDFIHEAIDSNKLISTEVLEFGHWGWEDGTYEAFVCGKDLTHTLWKQAKEKFSQNGGTLKSEEEPPKTAKKKPPKSDVNIRKVKFVREDRQRSSVTGQILTYRVHRGPDAKTAKAFLEKNPVKKALYYIIVETPEGNYGRDIDGIYKE